MKTFEITISSQSHLEMKSLHKTCRLSQGELFQIDWGSEGKTTLGAIEVLMNLYFSSELSWPISIPSLRGGGSTHHWGRGNPLKGIECYYDPVNYLVNLVNQLPEVNYIHAQSAEAMQCAATAAPVHALGRPCLEVPRASQSCRPNTYLFGTIHIETISLT